MKTKKELIASMLSQYAEALAIGDLDRIRSIEQWLETATMGAAKPQSNAYADNLVG